MIRLGSPIICREVRLEALEHVIGNVDTLAEIQHVRNNQVIALSLRVRLDFL